MHFDITPQESKDITAEAPSKQPNKHKITSHHGKQSN